MVVTGAKGRAHYPQPLRRIKYYDAGTEKTFNFLSNHFAVSAPTVAQLYRHRWQVELFFKWIKQHLRIKSFFGTSENAVKTQIWIAVTVYVLVAVLRRRLGIAAVFYTILQVLSLTLFERMPNFKLFSDTDYNVHESVVTGGGKAAVERPEFRWVNTILGNVKNALCGTYHAVRPKYAQRYLAEFEYRFNRRFGLPDIIPRLVYVALRTPPMPERLLKLRLA